MVFTAVLLLLSAVWTHQVTATCNKGAIEKIKALHVETFPIDQILGDWKLVYFESGTMTVSFHAAKCRNISFSKEGKMYKVDYNNMGAGVKEIVQEDGLFVHRGEPNKEADMTYYTVQKSPDSVAFYICSEIKDFPLPEMSMALVRGNTDFSAKLSDTIETFKHVGLKKGESVTSCDTTTSQ